MKVDIILIIPSILKNKKNQKNQSFIFAEILQRHCVSTELFGITVDVSSSTTLDEIQMLTTTTARSAELNNNNNNNNNNNYSYKEHTNNCVNVEVDVPGVPSLISLMVYVDVKQHRANGSSVQNQRENRNHG